MQEDQNTDNLTSTNGKPILSLDMIIHDQLDQANKNSYYKAVQQQLGKAFHNENMNEDMMKEQTQIYVQSFRNYYYTSEVLAHNKSNDFFQEMIRELHPVTKIKGPVKGILKTFCKIFVQELAQTCFEVMYNSKRTELDSQVISDAYRLLQKRKPRTNNFSGLFNYIL